MPRLWGLSMCPELGGQTTDPETGLLQRPAPAVRSGVPLWERPIVLIGIGAGTDARMSAGNGCENEWP